MRPRPNNFRFLLAAFLLAALLAPCAAAAQTGRDPLNPDEIDQLQESAGDLGKRVDLLLQFAHQRLADFDSIRTMSPRPPDRANKLYDLLRQYEQILPEIDDNLNEIADGFHTSASDVGKYNLPKISAAVIAAESAMRQSLTAIQTNSTPSDLATYHFVLQDCLDTTDDSLTDARQAQADAHKKKSGGVEPPLAAPATPFKI